jgi:hypothetical protein
MDIESIIGETEPAETSVTLCVKGSLRAEYERLDAQLGDIEQAISNLAGGDTAGITSRMAELRKQMLAYERTFNLRAVEPLPWSNLVARRPVKTPGMTDEDYAPLYYAWVCEVVAVSVVDPVMTPDQAARFRDRLSAGDWQKLANAAWNVNDDSSTIPFSVAASVLSRSSGEKSKPQETSDNPAHASLAGNPNSEPASSTTNKAGSLGGSPRKNRSGRTKTGTS